MTNKVLVSGDATKRIIEGVNSVGKKRKPVNITYKHYNKKV